MLTIISALMPFVASLLMKMLDKSKANEEDKKRFREAVNSISALRSKNFKKDHDALYQEMQKEDFNQKK